MYYERDPFVLQTVDFILPSSKSLQEPILEGFTMCWHKKIYTQVGLASSLSSLREVVHNVAKNTVVMGSIILMKAMVSELDSWINNKQPANNKFLCAHSHTH